MRSKNSERINNLNEILYKMKFITMSERLEVYIFTNLMLEC